MQPGTMHPGNNGNPPDFTNDTAFQEQMVKDLESKGIDTTDLKAAITSGDKEKVRAVMDGLRDKMSQPPMNGTPGKNGHGAQDYFNNTTFQEQMVKNLESKGIDTTELKAAMASGDKEKVRAVMDGLRDKIPQPAMNGLPGKDGNQQGNDGLDNKPADKQAAGSDSKHSGQPQQTQKAQPTQTRSPLSTLTILAGIGAAGLAVVSLRKR